MHDAVREETNEPISRRSDVDALSLRVVAVDVDPQRAAGVPPGLLQVVNARDPPLIARPAAVDAEPRKVPPAACPFSGKGGDASACPASGTVVG